MRQQEIIQKATEVIKKNVGQENKNKVRFYFIESQRDLEISDKDVIIGMYCSDATEELYEELKNELIENDLKVTAVENKLRGLEVSY